MIISASRRTDIPAFYSNWLVNRLKAGYVLVRNPLNFRQVSRIALSPKNIECLVFWTKNPREMLAKLSEIDDLGYRYYFLFTLTPYDRTIEVNVPDFSQRIETFLALAGQIGRKKIIWRYDPILFTKRYSEQFHSEAFAQIADRLSGMTKRCIVSFVQMYQKCTRNMQSIDLLDRPAEGRIALLRTLREVGAAHGITVQLCAPGIELEHSGIPSGKCIDDRLIAQIIGMEVNAEKDRNQRKECGCIASIDIGAYNSCPHHCLYCYANNDQTSVATNLAGHDPNSPLLYGALQKGDRLSDRFVQPIRKKQLKLF